MIAPRALLATALSVVLATSGTGLLATGVHAAGEPAADKTVPAVRSKAQVITLGTGGGPSYRDKRAMSSNAVVIGEDVYIVDTGDGLMHRYASAGLSVDQIRAVFISHHHFDHNGDLGSLLMFRWLALAKGKLPVIGPPLTVNMVQQLARGFRATEVSPITIGGPDPAPVAATIAPRDLPGNLLTPQVVYRDSKVTVTAVLNDHYHFPAGSKSARLARSYAFRFDTPDRSIVFTGDTGPSRRVEALARGADVLVAEVIDLPRIEKQWRESGRADQAYVDGLVAHLREDHLTPTDVGRMAKAANVGMVVLTHLVPGWDDEKDPDVYAHGVREVYSGRVFVANDLDRF